MKPTFLKVWPEIEGYAPLLTSPSDASKSTNLFNIDFYGCYSADSCGLAAFLLKILDITNSFDKDSSWICTGLDNDSALKERIAKLQFFYPIISSLNKKSKLLESEFLSSNNEPVQTESFGVCKISFPLVFFDFSDGDDRRTAGEKLFKYILIHRLKEYFNKYDIDTMQWISIIIELIRNTADHTEANAVFGMDILKTGKNIKLNFLYGDLGIGIMQHIRDYYRKIDDPQWKKLDLSGAYHGACKKGFTTNLNSGRNFGMGMSTVIEFTKTMDMRLSVFDANSRGLLSDFDLSGQSDNLFDEDLYSHSSLRRNFYNFSRRNPFCYFGTVEARQK